MKSTKKKLAFASLEPHIFYIAYAGIPFAMRDKCCGLSWNDVYELMKKERS